MQKREAFRNIQIDSRTDIVVNDVPGPFIEQVHTDRAFVFRKLRSPLCCPGLIVPKDFGRSEFLLIQCEPL